MNNFGAIWITEEAILPRFGLFTAHIKFHSAAFVAESLLTQEWVIVIKVNWARHSEW